MIVTHKVSRLQLYRDRSSLFWTGATKLGTRVRAIDCDLHHYGTSFDLVLYHWSLECAT